VTGLPSPWGVNEILNTLTPMVAQSSDDASLTTNGTFAVCVPPADTAELPVPPELPPPQAMSEPASDVAIINLIV